MVDKFVLFVVINAPVIVKVLRSLWKWKCFYQCFPMLVQFVSPPKLSNFLQYPLSLGFTKKTHIFSDIKIYTNTFFCTFVYEVWQSIRSKNLSYFLWSLLRSSWKWKCFSSSGHRESVISSSGHCESESVFSSSGHCESKCVSIDVYQNWSNLILTFDIDQFLPLWKGVDTGWIG